MEQSFWRSRWNEGRIAFHRAAVSPELERFADAVLVGRGAALVPLCGKTLDLVWLAARFERVIGIEFVRQAVVDFFAGLEVTPTVTRAHDAEIFAHGNLELRIQDIFDLRRDQLPPLDAVWDRAALIALPDDVRPRYAAHIQALMQPDASGLLVTLDYPQALMSGPPFAVSDAEVARLYPDARRLAHTVIDERRPNLPADAVSTSSVFSFGAG